MRRNRLIIEYNASMRASIPQGTKESMLCKSKERAKQIVGMRSAEIVKEAIFIDESFEQYKIV